MAIEAKHLVSEFIGTYMLVLTIGCNVISGSGTWAALSIASSLMVSIYALGTVSGAHFNPAVTLAIFLTGEDKTLDGAKVGAYMGTQLVAGIAAGFSYLWLFGSAFNLAPQPGFSWKEAGAIEVLYTFMLCFVVLTTAVSEKLKAKNAEYFGLAIGFVIVAGGYAGGWISGGCFNPAVAFGIDFASAGEGVFWCLPYLAFEFVGAALAAGAYVLVRDNKKTALQLALSEFLGTFFLVLTVGLNVLGASPAPALSIGASLMCMIYALGGVSGAHFNPAVTTALTLAGKFQASALPLYIGAQLLGALAAAFTYTGIVGRAIPLAPGASHSWAAAGVAEAIYTFVLCFTVLNVAALSKDAHMSEGGKSTQMYGLAIGFCIVVGGFAIGAVSGGSLNPAVSIALDATNAAKGGSFLNSLPYTAFELVGAAGAAGALALTRNEEFSKDGKLPLASKTYGSC